MFRMLNSSHSHTMPLFEIDSGEIYRQGADHRMLVLKGETPREVQKRRMARDFEDISIKFEFMLAEANLSRQGEKYPPTKIKQTVQGMKDTTVYVQRALIESDLGFLFPSWIFVDRDESLYRVETHVCSHANHDPEDSSDDHFHTVSLTHLATGVKSERKFHVDEQVRMLLTSQQLTEAKKMLEELTGQKVLSFPEGRLPEMQPQEPILLIQKFFRDGFGGVNLSQASSDSTPGMIPPGFFILKPKDSPDSVSKDPLNSLMRAFSKDAKEAADNGHIMKMFVDGNDSGESPSGPVKESSQIYRDLEHTLLKALSSSNPEDPTCLEQIGHDTLLNMVKAYGDARAQESQSASSSESLVKLSLKDWKNLFQEALTKELAAKENIREGTKNRIKDLMMVARDLDHTEEHDVQQWAGMLSLHTTIYLSTAYRVADKVVKDTLRTQASLKEPSPSSFTSEPFDPFKEYRENPSKGVRASPLNKGDSSRVIKALPPTPSLIRAINKYGHEMPPKETEPLSSLQRPPTRSKLYLRPDGRFVNLQSNLPYPLDLRALSWTREKEGSVILHCLLTLPNFPDRPPHYMPIPLDHGTADFLEYLASFEYK